MDLQKREDKSEVIRSHIPAARLAGRGLLLLFVFAAVGLFTARQVTRHAATGGAAPSQVQLTAAMAGLFAGGAAALLTGIGMAAMARDPK